VSCAPLQHRFPNASSADDLLSWAGIAAAVRSHARNLQPKEAEELLKLADLLDGFAELESAGPGAFTTSL
jgi:hypothetical protein